MSEKVLHVIRLPGAVTLAALLAAHAAHLALTGSLAQVGAAYRDEPRMA